MRFAAGVRLVSARPANTTVNTELVVSVATEITRIIVANVSADMANFQLYHSRDAVVNEADALMYDVDVKNAEFFDWGAEPGSGLQLRPGDRLAFRSSVSEALVLSVYGVTANIAPEGS